jgi:hypothetical protein
MRYRPLQLTQSENRSDQRITNATDAFLSKPRRRILHGMPKPPRPLDPLQEMFGLYVEAYLRRDELLAECQRLVEAGQKRAAKRCLEAAEELQGLLTRLARAVRRAP